MLDRDGANTVQINSGTGGGVFRAGGFGANGRLSLRRSDGKETVRIDAATGDVVLYWYRHDRDGTWSHKPGGTEATNLDNSDHPITDPARGPTRRPDRGPAARLLGSSRPGMGPRRRRGGGPAR